MMRIEDIAIGDVVYLNSGSPPLVVWLINQGSTRLEANNVAVRWFSDDKLHNQATFPAACLTKDKPNGKE